MMPSLELGEILKEYRIRAEVSQLQAAQALGLSSPQYVSNIERNLCNPSDRYIAYAMKRFKIPFRLLHSHIMAAVDEHYTNVLKGK